MTSPKASIQMAERPSPKTSEQPSQKLQKVLAGLGLASRREAERWISAGRVQVNGRVAKLGDRVIEADKLSLDGRPVKQSKVDRRIRVLLYNKPVGEVSTRSDPEGRPTVFRKLPKLKSGRWISVGRLDINTSGLLLFTNNGELANKLAHPSSGVDREYSVRVHGEVDEQMLLRLTEGVLLEDGPARFSDVVPGTDRGANRWFTVTLMEGRNREVRRLWESQGVEVNRLKRVRFGPLFLPSYVHPGEWIELEHQAVADLCWQANLEEPRKQSLSPEERRSRQRNEQKLRSKGRRG